MTDPDLDQLFAQARQPTPADESAADRFLAWRREQREPVQRPFWLLWAAAAVLGAGLLVTRPAPSLPSADAYAVYEESLGAGW